MKDLYEKKVVKFGGSSLASAEQFRKSADIIKSEASRRFVVPSAPGKRFPKDTKVTDLLLSCYDRAAAGEDFSREFADIVSRYDDIINGLGLATDLSAEYSAIKQRLSEGTTRDYIASRGEYLNALILSEYIGYDFLDAAEVIFFDADGRFDASRTDRIMSERLAGAKNAVIPGFYGSMPDGSIKTFSRGGSDITGAIVARAVMADIYENWTDVSGFLMCDPRIVENPHPIKIITYRELRELSYMGAGVLHEDAIFPVRMAGIPINIRNTNEPDNAGTMIVRADESHVRGAITGIAGKKGFTAIAIEKNMMNSELGFGRRVLEALEECNVSFEHMPSGIDTMTVLVSDSNIAGRIDEVVEKIRRACKPDHIEVISGLSLVATVGRGMVRYPGTAARVFGALADSGINIRMIDQGSSEINIITGVESADFERAVNAIYNAFMK